MIKPIKADRCKWTLSTCLLAVCRSTEHSSWASSSGVSEQDLALTTAACARRVSKVNYMTQSDIKSTIALRERNASECQMLSFLFHLLSKPRNIVSTHGFGAEV